MLCKGLRQIQGGEVLKSVSILWPKLLRGIGSKISMPLFYKSFILYSKYIPPVISILSCSNCEWGGVYPVGVEPTTHWLRDTKRVFFIIIITAWYSVCYVAITIIYYNL